MVEAIDAYCEKYDRLAYHFKLGHEGTAYVVAAVRADMAARPDDYRRCPALAYPVAFRMICRWFNDRHGRGWLGLERTAELMHEWGLMEAWSRV